MTKFISMGEALIDLIPENGQYVAKPGGAPANVCAAVAKLYGEAYYLGKLSTDEYGDMLFDAISKANINTSLIIRDDRFLTATAKVTLDESGDRKFTFSRVNTADLMLNPDEIDDKIFDAGDILHFCSVCLVPSDAKDAHIKALKIAQKKGALVSFDVNLRPALFNNDTLLVATVREFLQYADILKFSDEELSMIAGINDEKQAVKNIFDISPARVLFVTKGSNGASVYDRNLDSVSMPACDVKVVDTTGAGDAFIGAILYNVLVSGLKSSAIEYKSYLEFAIKASSIVVTRRGALMSMPTLLETISL